jgi:hypothetical protein
LIAVIEKPSYYALRVCPRADTPTWWAAARADAHNAPPAIRAIIDRRTRVEVSCQAATEALAWARQLDGWEHAGPTPVWVYPMPPT